MTFTSVFSKNLNPVGNGELLELVYELLVTVDDSVMDLPLFVTNGAHKKTRQSGMRVKLRAIKLQKRTNVERLFYFF
jgi:hypothetical protein